MRWYNVIRDELHFVRADELLYHEYGITYAWIPVRDARGLGYRHPHAELTSC